MNWAFALHNAVRRYCTDRAAEAGTRYSQLIAENRAEKKLPDGTRTYTDEAYDIFPRGKVVSAILHEVERFVPADFGSVEECRDLLTLAGETAQSPFTKLGNPVQDAATRDERQRFIQFVKSANLEELAGLPTLPFRRVLGAAEHRQLHALLETRWGKWYGGYVDPKAARADVVTLHTAAMEATGSYEGIRRALLARGIARVLELREYDDGYELETAAAEFTYSGAEGFWTSGDMEWMVYASHESSITFGGSWITAAMRECLPEFDRYLYRGWELSKYNMRDADQC